MEAAAGPRGPWLTSSATATCRQWRGEGERRREGARGRQRRGRWHGWSERMDAKSTGGGVCQSVLSAAARQRRKRINEKTAELSRLIPGGHKMNTAQMLEEAARHVKLLQAQVGVLALMRAVGSNEREEEEMASVAQDQMHALLVRGRVQERLAAAGRCLAPTKLVDAVAKDTSNAVVNRDLRRFVASLQALGQ